MTTPRSETSARAASAGLPPWAWAAALLGLAVGLATAAVGLGGAEPARGWQALFVNFLFWSSMAFGALAWSAGFRVARASWSAAVNRLGHAMLWYLPFCAVIFAVLYLGRASLVPALHLQLGYRQRWLSAPNIFARDGALLLVTIVLAWLYVHTYLRVDRVPAGGVAPDGWRGEEEETTRAGRRLSRLGVALLYAYVFAFTMIGFDLVMALQPVWHSALFGWYFTLASAYSGIALLAILGVLLRRWLGVSELIDRTRRRYVGNLLLAFSMLMTYFFFSQALPIWYENLLYEIPYAIPRVHTPPWPALSLVVLFTAYLGVFACLVVREMKEIPVTLGLVGGLALGGTWLERYLLVVPSLTPHAPLSPLLVLGMGAGFLGVLILTTGLFLTRHPAASRLDLALARDLEEWQCSEARPKGLRWLKPAWSAAVLAAVGTLAYLTIVLGHPYAVGPEQPLPFSHRIHAGHREISCVFCHDAVDHSQDAGMPAVQRCLLCHNIIIKDLDPIRKLHHYADTNTPIPWVRVYQLRDYVHFSHSLHLAAGHDCGECHGNVKEMDRITEVEPIKMGFCIDCHRKNGAPVDCTICHY